MVNCIIIEDEPLAIKKLVNYIDKLPRLNLLETFHSAVEAIGYINENSVDLIFLDIEMKELSGIQLLESINTKAKVIITTAYSQYAIKGFELQVCDYLLKPITFERFVKACDKVIQDFNKQITIVHSKIFVKTEYRLEGINTADILYIEGMGDYKRIITSQKKIMTLETFKDLLNKLPNNKFCRVHNSYIVSLDRIENIERNRITINKKLIPISDSYGKEFYNSLNS
ncbi:MAG: LytTR family DNA-binding domain-containing protein [Flaviramulus sp.]|nr:LytTR family DNA-binding domain-containing protein [Flaviramulus sp.]